MEGQGGCSTRGRLFGELGASVFVVRLTLEAERKSPSTSHERFKKYSCAVDSCGKKIQLQKYSLQLRKRQLQLQKLELQIRFQVQKSFKINN